VYHFSPPCNTTHQREPGVLRTEGVLLHPRPWGGSPASVAALSLPHVVGYSGLCCGQTDCFSAELALNSLFMALYAASTDLKLGNQTNCLFYAHLTKS
jgi:hypothetical protein